jgi:hypothetical protein
MAELLNDVRLEISGAIILPVFTPEKLVEREAGANSYHRLQFELSNPGKNCPQMDTVDADSSLLCSYDCMAD